MDQQYHRQRQDAQSQYHHGSQAAANAPARSSVQVVLPRPSPTYSEHSSRSIAPKAMYHQSRPSYPQAPPPPHDFPMQRQPMSWTAPYSYQQHQQHQPQSSMLQHVPTQAAPPSYPQVVHPPINHATDSHHSQSQSYLPSGLQQYIQPPLPQVQTFSDVSLQPMPTPSQPHQHISLAQLSNPRLPLPAAKSPTNLSLTAHPRGPSDEQSADQRLLLSALADQYLTAAYQIGPAVSQATTDHTTDSQSLVTYHKLLTASISCHEAILRLKSTDPRMEARVRLRLARILFQETDNDTQVGEILSKGLGLCERHRLVDIQYSMQHLLARLMHKTNPRAAQKHIDKLLTTVKACHLVHWTFAFHFLKLSLVLDDDEPQYTTCLSVIHAIKTLASSGQATVVMMLADLLEANIAIRIGGESLDVARRALASARAHQLDPAVASVVQLSALASMLDLACELTTGNSDGAQPKLEAMQKLVDNIGGSDWNPGGDFTVPIPGAVSADVEADTGRIFLHENGQCTLSLEWLRRSGLYSICYLMSGVAFLQQGHADVKAEKFLLEAIKLAKAPRETSDMSIQQTREVEHRRVLTVSALHLCLALAYCNRSAWADARRCLDAVRPGPGAARTCATQMHMYLDGVVLQGQGHIDAALDRYSSPDLALAVASDSSIVKPTGTDTILRVLATFNSVLALSNGDETSRRRAQTLIESVRAYCESPQCSRTASAAFWLLHAIIDPQDGLHMKADIQKALHLSKQANNHLILAMTLNVLDARLFNNIVGEQAEKSAHSSAELSKRALNPLLAAVAYDKWARNMRLHGKEGDAVGKTQRADEYMSCVGPVLQERFKAC